VAGERLGILERQDERRIVDSRFYYIVALYRNLSWYIDCDVEGVEVFVKVVKVEAGRGLLRCWG